MTAPFLASINTGAAWLLGVVTPKCFSTPTRIRLPWAWGARTTMRIAIFVGPFPKVSETFIIRQITGLLDLGHEVDIYAEMRPEEESPVQPAVIEYGLLSRTTYMDMPLEAGYWEL